MIYNIFMNNFILKTGLTICKRRYMKTCSRWKMSNTLFKGQGDRFRGVTVHSDVEGDCSDFAKKLEASLDYWKSEKKRTIWFRVHLNQTEWVPILAKKGFKYHHAKEDYVMMYIWLPKDETNNIPPFAHTLIGVGAVVVNDKSQVLVVKEKYATRTAWKLPGGYVEPGENLIDAVVREVMEETNICTEFQSVIAFRHTHGRVYNCSDIYVVFSLKPTSKEISKSNQEISECIWMDIEQYLSHSEIHSLNKLLVEKYLEYKDKQITIDCMSGVHQILKVPFTFYSVTNFDQDNLNVADKITADEEAR